MGTKTAKISETLAAEASLQCQILLDGEKKLAEKSKDAPESRHLRSTGP